MAAASPSEARLGVERLADGVSLRGSASLAFNDGAHSVWTGRASCQRASSLPCGCRCCAPLQGEASSPREQAVCCASVRGTPVACCPPRGESGGAADALAGDAIAIRASTGSSGPWNQLTVQARSNSLCQAAGASPHEARGAASHADGAASASDDTFMGSLLRGGSEAAPDNGLPATPYPLREHPRAPGPARRRPEHCRAASRWKPGAFPRPCSFPAPR